MKGLLMKILGYLITLYKKMYLYIFLILFLFTLLNPLFGVNYFELNDTDEIFRIENQLYGESIVQDLSYLSRPFLFQGGISAPYESARFKLQNAGNGYYKLFHFLDSYYLFSSSMQENSEVGSSTNGDGDSRMWKIELVDPKGLYTIQNKDSGLYLSSYYDTSVDSPYRIRKEHGKLVQRSLVSGDKTFLWAIEAERADVMDCIGITQIGWDPNARKMAVFNSTEKLDGNLGFLISSNGNIVMQSEAVPFKSSSGSESMYGLYYYIMNFSSITTPGEYELHINGMVSHFTIKDDAYVYLRHRYGYDISRYDDFFSPEWGFITNWARMSNWFNDYRIFEKDYLDNNLNWEYPYYQKLTVVDWATGTNQYTNIIPQEHMSNRTMGKGWNHTDQQWGFFEPTAVTLLLLVDLWRYNPDPDALKGIEDEILYGVNSLLAIQHPEGNFPQNTFCENAYTGTVAACGMALAASYEPLKYFYPEKAQEVLVAAEKAWDWVEAHNSVNDWVPYQTQYYRYGFAQMRMGLNVELYLATDDVKYKNIADDMILNATFDGMGCWINNSGSKFAGEEAYPSHTSIFGLLRYYPYADQDIRDAIKRQMKELYDLNTSDSFLYGPYSEGNIHAYGDSYDFAFKAYKLFKIYEFFGDEFSNGYFIAQKLTDRMFGFNQFATSMVLGCGDVFAAHPYRSGYMLGRLVPGIILEGGTIADKISASNGSYNIGESGGAAQPLMMLDLVLRERLKNIIPRTVTLYSGANYTGSSVEFPTGEWQGYEILKEGFKLGTVGSIKIPNGLSLITYKTENFQDLIDTYTIDIPTLTESVGNIYSFKVRFENSFNKSPQIISFLPADGASFISGSDIDFSLTAQDDEDSTINDNHIYWYSNLDGFLGNGADLTTQLSDGTHLITVYAKDNDLASDVRYFMLHIGNDSPTPIVNKDAYETAFNTELSINVDNGVLHNDIEPLGNSLSIILKTSPTNGTLSINTDGSFVYTPNTNYSGMDTFSYAASNGVKESDACMVTIKIMNSQEGVPLNVPGCVLWLDAVDVNADGSLTEQKVITSWHDKSNNRFIAQGQGALSTKEDGYNKHPVMLFDGSWHKFTFQEISDIRTVFWVLNDATGGAHCLLGHSTGTAFKRGSSSIWATSAAEEIKNGTTRLNGSIIDPMNDNLSLGQMSVLSLVTTGNVSADNFSFDADVSDSLWNGSLGELIVFNRELTTDEVNNVESYLQNKWFSYRNYHSLIVNNGYGSGDYCLDELIPIKAYPKLNMVFKQWTGDTQGIADIHSPETSYLISNSDVIINAEYEQISTGTYLASGTVTGDIFSEIPLRIGDRIIITDSNGAYTIDGLQVGTYSVTPVFNGYSFTPSFQTFTIVDSSLSGIDFSSHKDQWQFSVTVNDGTGDGIYYTGNIVNITAKIPFGKVFDSWTGDVSFINDPTVPVTSFSMPEQDVVINANFKDPPVNTYSISGTVSGDKIDSVYIFIDESHYTYTNSDGTYDLSGLSNGTYYVKAKYDGYIYSPISKTVVISSDNQTGIDFATTDHYIISNPLDFPGCKLWLDASDPHGDGSIISGLLSSWVNKSDSNIIAWQGTDSKKASIIPNSLSDLPILDFMNDENKTYSIYLQDTGASVRITGQTFFWVLKAVKDNSDIPHFFLGDTENSPFHPGIGDVNDNWLADGKYWDDNFSAPEVRNGRTFLMGQEVDGVNDVFPTDEFKIVSLVATGPVSFNEISQDRVGNYGLRSFSGSIAEIIVYDSQLSDSEREGVEAYLQYKWFTPKFSVSGTVTGDYPEFVKVFIDGNFVTETDENGTYFINDIFPGPHTVSVVKPGFAFSPEDIDINIVDVDITNIDFTSIFDTDNHPISLPSDVPGCNAWFDAAAITNADPNSSSVSFWKNKVEGANAMQSTESIQPKLLPSDLNNLSVLNFDASGGQFFSIVNDTGNYTDISGNTFFWVLESNEDSETPHFMLGSTLGTPFYPGVDDSNRPDGTFWDETLAAQEVLNGNLYLDAMPVNGINTLLPKNSFHFISLVTDGVVSFDKISGMDGSSSWYGKIAEIIVFNRSLHDYERQAVEEYLSQKWFAQPSLKPHSISGKITGTVLENIKLSIDDEHYAFSDYLGNYTIVGILDGTYTITPSFLGYEFLPENTDVTIDGDNIKNIDFSSSIKTFNLLVENGSGSGNYDFNSKIQITASIPPDMVFVKWDGDVDYINDSQAVDTFLTMPATNISISAVFSYVYSIDGHISGDISQGITVSIDENHFAVTDENGYYFIGGLLPGTYTVTPLLHSYTFSPESLELTIIDESLNDIDFESNAVPYSLTVENGIGSGQYYVGDNISISASVLPDTIFDFWSGDIEYIDDPKSEHTSLLMPDGNITIKANFINLYSLKGTISGELIEGITVYVDETHSALTDENGNFSINGLPPGIYTAIPKLTGCSFEPQAQSFTILDEDVDPLDFSSILNKYSLTVENGLGSGLYTINQQVTVTAIVPPELIFNSWKGDSQYLNNSELLSSTFSMPPQNIQIKAAFKVPPIDTFSISGKITGVSSGGVFVSVDATHATFSRDDGVYKISGLINGSYSVVPKLDSFLFIPEKQEVIIDGADLHDIDFTVDNIGQWTLSGVVKDIKGNPFQGVKLTLNNGRYVFSDELGQYSFPFMENGDYQIVPLIDNYYFAPNNKAITIMDADFNEVDFTAMKNNPPIAADDTEFKMITGNILEVPASGVLANDFDPDGNLLTVSLTTQTQHGTIVLDSDGSFTYQPEDGFIGEDSFEYIANDGTVDSNIAKVLISVEEPNMSPIAVDDLYHTEYETTLKVSPEMGVLVNDSDPENDNLNAVIVSSPKHGSLEFNDDGSFIYKPDKYFSGNDSFVYNVFDYRNKGNNANVNIIVNMLRITLGSSVFVDPKQIKDFPGGNFDKQPTLYGTINGKKLVLKKDKSASPKIVGIWKKKYPLNGKIKNAFASSINGKKQDLPVSLSIKGKISGQKFYGDAYELLLSPPLIDACHLNGSRITVEGLYFGSKIPKVMLEPISSGKIVRCKVDKNNYHFDPISGKSSLKAELNTSKINSGTYWLILDNKIGIGILYSNEEYSLPKLIIP
jgi:hypothetical protein